MEGEYLYLRKEDVKDGYTYVKYCTRIPLNEFPDYMKLAILNLLGMYMCQAFKQYLPKLEIFKIAYDSAINAIQANEIDTVVKIKYGGTIV